MQIRKSEECFAWRRALASGGGAASLVGIRLVKSSDFVQERQSIVRQLLMLFVRVAWDCAKTGHPSHARLEGEIIGGLLQSLASLLGHTGFAEYLSFDAHLEELDPLELPGKVEAACKSMLKKLA